MDPQGSVFKPGREESIFVKNLPDYSREQWDKDEDKARNWLTEHPPEGVNVEAWENFVEELNGQTILMLFNINTISRLVDDDGNNIIMPFGQPRLLEKSIRDANKAAEDFRTLRIGSRK